MLNEEYRQEVIRLFDLQRFGMKFGLANIERMLDLLGNPQPGKRTVIVGGTNGKGSVAAMLASIAREAGIRTGLFTSPHLVSFTERILIDGERISKEDVIYFARRLWNVLEPYRTPDAPEPTTFFEALTAIAADYFHQKEVELAIFEVGLGGRLDATNALHRDLLVLTDIAHDHGYILGDTIAQIVYEKASLMRRATPVVATGGLPEVADLLVKHAFDAGADLYLLGRDFQFEDKVNLMNLIVGEKSITDLPLSLHGSHQLRNAAAAVHAALLLGIDDEECLRRGLANAKWPGRLELFPGNPSVLLDCAHNPAGAEALAASLDRYHPSVLLTTVMADKDVKGVIRHLAANIHQVVCTTLPMERATPAERMGEIAREAGMSAMIEADTEKAFALAKEIAGPDGCVLVAGSIYLIGYIRGLLTGEQGP